MVNPCELKHKIKIYLPTSTKDSSGYKSNTAQPTLFHECWAKFSRAKGTELIKSNADFSDVSVRFLIRYTSKVITRKMTILYNSTSYEIEYINDYEDKHEYIEILASEVSL